MLPCKNKPEVVQGVDGVGQCLVLIAEAG